MALRQRRPDPPCGCGCEQLAQRLADAETTIAALARAAVSGGLAPDVRDLGRNRKADNRADAATIRTAAGQGITP